MISFSTNTAEYRVLSLPFESVKHSSFSSNRSLLHILYRRSIQYSHNIQGPDILLPQSEFIHLGKRKGFKAKDSLPCHTLASKTLRRSRNAYHGSGTDKFKNGDRKPGLLKFKSLFPIPSMVISELRTEDRALENQTCPEEEEKPSLSSLEGLLEPRLVPELLGTQKIIHDLALTPAAPFFSYSVKPQVPKSLFCISVGGQKVELLGAFEVAGSNSCLWYQYYHTQLGGVKKHP
ncbi:hypothetical protein HOY82DRAFT_543061 [Tuber indicum]|nr:hypothetical protein HOY82DRAFT_543061 [Tuber indicum]